jgi:uncharacterized protein (TIGR04255 family)
MKIPIKINKCPINEAILEIRFTSETPADAIFGIIYQEIKKDGFEKYTRMPILDFPADIREKDENLKYLPHYRLKKENIIIQIGPRVLSVINEKEYLGWDKYSDIINRNLQKLFDLKIAKEITRVGLRYVNIFKDKDIFNYMKLIITLDDTKLQSITNNLFFIIKNDDILNNLRIINNAIITNNVNKVSYNGSIYDIDTYMESGNLKEDTIYSIIEKLHAEEKQQFFSFLKEAFIRELEPIYKE